MEETISLLKPKMAQIFTSMCYEHGNNQVYKISYTNTRTQVDLVPNLNYETKKTIIKTKHVENNNSTRFYYKNETRTKQECDKKTYPKLVLKRLKGIKNHISIYTPWGSNSMKPSWKLCPHVWPMA
jgi:hypothetical protein